MEEKEKLKQKTGDVLGSCIDMAFNMGKMEAIRFILDRVNGRSTSGDFLRVLDDLQKTIIS